MAVWSPYHLVFACQRVCNRRPLLPQLSEHRMFYIELDRSILRSSDVVVFHPDCIPQPSGCIPVSSWDVQRYWDWRLDETCLHTSTASRSQRSEQFITVRIAWLTRSRHLHWFTSGLIFWIASPTRCKTVLKGDVAGVKVRDESIEIGLKVVVVSCLKWF